MPVAREISRSRQTLRDFGTSLKFDGVDGVITENLFSTFTTTTPATISFWAKLDQAPTNSADSQPIIVTKYFYIYARLVSAGVHTFFIRFDEASARQRGGTVAPYSEWNHFVFIYNPTGGNNVTLEAYINGNKVDSGDYTTLPTSAKTAIIGKSGSTYFKGRLDEIKVWNRVLTEDEAIDEYLGLPVSDTDLVTYYKADEGSGSVVNDSAGSNDGAIAGGVTYVTDPPLGILVSRTVATDRFTVRDMGKSLAFSGTNTSLVLPITPSLVSFSVGFWIFVRTNSASNIIMSYSTDEATTGFRLYHHTSQRVFFQSWDGSLTANMSSGNGSIPYGKWTHVVITYEAGSAKLYVDGVLKNSDPTATFAVPTGQSLTFGKRSYANTWGGFLMDELIWANGSVWDLDAIKDLYYRGIRPSAPTGLYLFEDSVADSSGNGNTGVLSNGSYLSNSPIGIRTAIS